MNFCIASVTQYPSSRKKRVVLMNLTPSFSSFSPSSCFISRSFQASLHSLCLFEQVDGGNHLAKLRLGCPWESLNSVCTKYLLLRTVEMDKTPTQASSDCLTEISRGHTHACVNSQIHLFWITYKSWLQTSHIWPSFPPLLPLLTQSCWVWPR